MSRYSETTGYIIHTRNFKDTSLIIEFFSKDFGKINLIAKGIKKNKNLKPQLQYFSLCKIHYFGKSQLKTLATINIIENRSFEMLIDKTTALYLNELLRYSLVDNDKATSLFECYQQSLKKIGTTKLTPLLREYEQEILKYNGQELCVDSFDRLDDWITISENFGLSVSSKSKDNICQVKDLKSFLIGDKLTSQIQRRINNLMIKAIDVNMSYRKIYSREILKSLLSQ